jgi:hypothetical protein
MYVRIVSPALFRMNEYLREYEFEESSPFPTIKVCQNPSSELGHAGTVWDAALVLCAFLESATGREMLKDSKCIELGAGTAIVSIAAKTVGAAQVVATDLALCVPFMRQNIGLNASHLDMHALTAQALDWDKPETITPEMSGYFDWVLAADCVYAPESVGGLIRTILSLNPKKGIIVSNERRVHDSNSSTEKEFIKALYEAGFEGKAVQRDIIRPDWRCEDIDIVVFTRSSTLSGAKGA